MQPMLGIWKRFIRSLLVVDRCSLSWDVEVVYYKFISGGQKQPQLGIWKRLLEAYLLWTYVDSAGDLEEVY